MSVLAETKHLLSVVAGSLRPVQIDVRVAIPEDLVVTTRKREIILVLLNLIQNAAQTIAERRQTDGKILVAGAASAGESILEVSDWAGGIPADVAQRIFESGYTTGDGTGLGLYLSRRLVESNGGVLELVPLEGGSCFRLRLPDKK